ncbi:SGNH/GDSL hydrolase family protein [bacterium]|nr:SGNH/GDSL hydrolase family protein [bacterium]
MVKKNISFSKRSSSLFLSIAVFILLAGLMLTFVMCHKSPTGDSSKSDQVWIGTWATAPQLVEPGNMPPSRPGLTDNSLRQIVCVSIGGETIRVRFSNEFSTSPVTLKSVHIALSLGESVIDISTDRELLFNDSTEVTMAPGVAVTSDPVDFHLEPRSEVAITIHFGQTSEDVTGHPGSRTTSYLCEGNKLLAADFLGGKTTVHWFVINGIDVLAPKSAASIAILGNSITDGRGSGTNMQNRWPDELACRLLENPETQEVAVLNMGIGGNEVLDGGLGPTALSRFERDVLKQYGVRWLIILEGINDIGTTEGTEAIQQVATDLIDAFETMIDDAHAADILVYGATILPFKGCTFYYTEEREAARQTVNEWIRTSGRFDAVIDFDEAMQNPEDPLALIPEGDTGDHLHPNEAGYVMMAESIDLSLFTE